MLKLEYRFKPSVFFTFLCWGALIFVIEMFFVIAPITSSFTHMALLMLLSVTGAFYAFFNSKTSALKLNFFLITFFMFHVFVTFQVMMSGTSRSYTDLVFYWFGMLIVGCAGSFTMKSDKTEKYILHLLTILGLFFSIGIFLQMAFTDVFLKYQLSLLNSDYSSSLRRQVSFHQMYTGWTTQTFATCINLMLGIYGALLSWEREKKIRYILATLVMFVAFLLTGKRGPLLFMLVAYFLTNIVLSGSLDKIFKVMLKYLIMGVVAIIAMIGYVSTHSSKSRNSLVRLWEMFNGTGMNSDDVSNGRFELWSFALKLFRNNPVLGVGWRRYHELALLNLNEDIEAHNVYLQLLAECGIVGFLLYMVPIISGLLFTFCYLKKMQSRRNSSIYRLMKLSLAIQLFFLFYACTGNTLYDYCAHICYYFAFALCMYAKSHSNLSWREILQWKKL